VNPLAQFIRTSQDNQVKETDFNVKSYDKRIPQDETIDNLHKHSPTLETIPVVDKTPTVPK
jgi:hypothetical protein